MIYTQGPIAGIDWEDVDFIHCTLESPYKGGGLRFRLGTKDAKRNLDFDPNNRKSGPPYWPGAPIMYPENEPAVAGKMATWLMPASISAMSVGRNGAPVPNGALHAGFSAFGFFMAPLNEEDGLVGFTQSAERSRVAAFWAGFKFPSDRENKGRPQPQMSRIAAPDVPDVTVRPLSKSMTPLTDPSGREITIRIRDYWDFNRPDQYDAAELPQLPEPDEVTNLLQGMTEKEREYLLAMVRKGAASAK